jgi:hypothetical protein
LKEHEEMTRTSKQQRKYPSKPEEKSGRGKSVFKILIDGSNFLKRTFDNADDAENAAIDFCKGSSAKYMIVESRL